MAIRKRPYGDGAREFNRLWDAGSHQDKLDLCQKYGISYQTGKDWRIFAIDELPQNRIVSDKQPIINLSPIKLKPYEPIMVGRGDPETQVLVLGDGHADEITPTYNAGIYQKRMNTLYQRLLAITHLHRNMYPLNDLVILDVGDNVHGENPYQGATIGGVSMGAVDQVYELALPTIIELLVNLRQEFKSIKFYGVRGNHGRISRISPSTSNFDLMLYKALSQTKLPAGIEINYSDDFYIMPIIEGFRFFVFHGDQCRACVDSETECLTREGFKSYKELTAKDELLTYNMEGDVCEYQRLKNLYVYPYNGKMIRIKHRSMDMLLTPEHKCVVDYQLYPCQRDGRTSKSTERRLVRADELNYQCSLILTAELREGSYPQRFSDDFIRIIGWTLTEGTVGKKQKRIQIAQSLSEHPDYVNEIETAILNLGYSYTKRYDAEDRHIVKFYIRKEGYEVIKAVLPQAKPFPRWILRLPTRQLKILFNTLMKGDGSVDGRSFYTADLESRDIFQELCALIGTRSHIGKDRYRIAPVYMPHRSRKGWLTKERQGEENFNGIVWSPEVENKTFVARRRGKVFITGNTMGVPYFAMTRKIMSWYNTFGGNIPYFVCGHFHKEDYLRISSNTKLLMNGSLVSDDPYALEVVGTSSVPNYWTFGCHKNRGITWLYALMLDKATLPKGI